MKKLIEIKSWLTGEVLFSHECKNNTIKITLELALSLKTNLRYSDLSGSDLRYSNLSGSNLRYSDLSGSDLSGSDLSGSDLRYSNLSGSNLSGSNLSGSNLSGSNLRDSVGNKKEIQSLHIGSKWDVAFTNEILSIGCEQHLISEWKAFSNDTIDRMDAGALDWWNKWKEFIFTAIELSQEA